MLKSLNQIYRDRIAKGGPGSGVYDRGTPKDRAAVGGKVANAVARYKAKEKPGLFGGPSLEEMNRRAMADARERGDVKRDFGRPSGVVPG